MIPQYPAHAPEDTEKNPMTDWYFLFIEMGNLIGYSFAQTILNVILHSYLMYGFLPAPNMMLGVIFAANFIAITTVSLFFFFNQEKNGPTND